MSSQAFSWPVRVYYEDTDASGVVYHARYLQFFERARSEWLREQGLSHENLRADHAVVFTVANIEIDFLKPARLDDLLQVTVDIERRRGASLEFAQVMYRDGESELPLARAWVRVACVDAEQFRPQALPDVLFSNA